MSENKTAPKPGVDRLLQAHSYDGIQEYDNPLPTWWNILFIVTIVHSIGYGFWYHLGGPGKSMAEEYQAAHNEYEDKRVAREKAELATVNEDVLAKTAADAAKIGKGREVFLQKCLACHGANGEGLVGPNLTDNFQKNGASRMDIYKTVRGGVAGTAMIAWADQLSAEEMVDVSAYIGTLRGQNLPGKAAEGNPVEPFSK